MVHFKRDVGLCANASGFNLYWHGSTNIRREMQGQFIQAGLDDCFPFHETEEDYYSEKDARLNPIRLQWAFDHAEHRPDGQSDELTAFYKAWYSWASSEDGVPHGYAIYFPDGEGKFTRRRCTKAEYEAQQHINAKANLGEVTKHDI